MKGQIQTKVEIQDLPRNSKPDGGYGWIVCCGTFIVNFVVFGIHSSFGVVYANLLDDLKLGEMQTGKLCEGLFNSTSSILKYEHGNKETTLFQKLTLFPLV